MSFYVKAVPKPLITVVGSTKCFRQFLVLVFSYIPWLFFFITTKTTSCQFLL
jgi:hypothetical protein